MSLGIKETKELLGFVLSIGNAFGASLEDGEMTIGDLTEFVAPLIEAGDAFSDVTSIPAELADLSEEERVELLTYAKEKFSIPEEHVEDIVECGFETVAQIYELVQKIRALFQKPE